MKLTKIVEAFRDVEHNIKDNGELGDKVSHPVEISDQDAIKHYTNDSRAHNDLLHRRHHRVKGGSPEAGVYNEINTIQRIIRKQEPLSGLHVFSGVHADIDALVHLRGAKPFTTFRFHVPAFISTTTAFASVDSYAKLFHVSDASPAFRDFITAHDPSIKFYRNVLCFDLHGKKALKIDKQNGGVFGDDEKEFILPHSSDVEITGTPSIKLTSAAGSVTALVIWDAELIGTEDKDIAHHEDSDLQNLDVPKLKQLVFALMNNSGVRLDDQIEYRMIRGVERIAKMYADKSVRRECTGREMSYFEDTFLNFLFILQENDVLEKHKHQILEIFELLSANKKTLMASPLADTRPKLEVVKLLEKIF